MHIKILHILSTPRAEGTPNLVLDWMATGQHSHEIYCLHNEPAELTEKLAKAASWYDEGHHYSLPKVLKFIAIAASVLRVCQKRKPDLVICWPTGVSNWVAMGAKLAKVKHVMVHFGNPPNRGLINDWISRYVIWPLEMLGAKGVCCSDFVRNEYQRIPFIDKKLFQTVHNCTKASEVIQRSAKARVERIYDGHTWGIMVATLEFHKDHDTLLNALVIVFKEVPHFRFRIVGGGSLKGRYVALAKALGIEDRVDFLGSRTDVPELLGQSDLFVFSTTLQEGLGTVLFEALAAGLPVIATDVPACREALQNGSYGTLVPLKDSKALAEAISCVVKYSDRATEADPVEYAMRFTPEKMMNAYFNLVGLY